MRRFYPFGVMLALTAAAFAQQNNPATQNPNPQASQSQPMIEENPVTVRPNGSDAKTPATDDPFAVAPLPKGKTSMIGGIISKFDSVHNKMSVKIFEDGTWDLAFDERTHFFLNGQETTFENVKKGDRVYVDTMLDGHQILARNVRVITKTVPADARGQIMQYNNGFISVQDTLSNRPLRFQVNDKTVVERGAKAGSLADLQPGALIEVRFAPERQYRGTAREVKILASPGENFSFAGRVTYIDMSSGMIAIENQTDSKMYDIAFDPDGLPSDLVVGSDVSVSTSFDGKRYKASEIKIEKTTTPVASTGS